MGKARGVNLVRNNGDEVPPAVLLYRKQTGDIVQKPNVGLVVAVPPEEQVGGSDSAQILTLGNRN